MTCKPETDPYQVSWPLSVTVQKISKAAIVLYLNFMVVIQHYQRRQTVIILLQPASIRGKDK